MLVVVSYLTSVFTYLVIVHVTGLLRGPLWDDSFRSPLVFVMVVIAAIAMLIPYFQREWDPSTRALSVLSAFFLLAFASLSTTHLGDPAIPLSVISRYLMEPMRHFLKF